MPTPRVELKCVKCGKVFTRDINTHKYNSKKSKEGPFCSRSCVGKTFHRIKDNKKKDKGNKE